MDATDVPIGLCLLTAPDLPDIETDPHDAEIKRIYLLHRFHGRGLGRRMLDLAEAEARRQNRTRLLLGVYHQNPTLAWYARQSFQQVGTRRFQVGANMFRDLILAKSL